MPSILYIFGDIQYLKTLITELEDQANNIHLKNQSFFPYFKCITIDLSNKIELTEQIKDVLKFFNKNKIFLKKLLDSSGITHAELNFIVESEEKLSEPFSLKLNELILKYDIPVTISELPTFNF